MENVDTRNLKSALETLKASLKKLDEYKECDITEMLEDACIKRFEYTLEIARKLMKKVLKKIYGKTEDELTVNNTFRFMEGYNFIENWQAWRDYYEKRNNTANEYNIKKSRKLMLIIPHFAKDVELLIKNFDEKLS